MPKYMIERELPGIGQAPKEAYQEGARASCVVLKEIGPEIQWVQSYVTGDKLYCVYIAPNEDTIKKHAAKEISKTRVTVNIINKTIML